MSTAAQLLYSPLSRDFSRRNGARPVTQFGHAFADNTNFSSVVSFPSLKCRGHVLLNNPNFDAKFHLPCAGGGSDIGIGRGSGGGGGGGGGDSGGGGWSGGGDSDESRSSKDGFGPMGAFLSGWISRVAADPQFPFKVLMEELVGVTSCVIGDMASRPNFGLNELDFVFSTLIVGSILNFTLMYLLAPTLSTSVQTLPGIFASSPTGHMFEPGTYSLLSRLGTFVYKGTVFAAVGFGAGLVGTVISNGLISMRKKMDPNFETPNKAPPTVLNAFTWSLHMGISSNFRYQTLNGMEFLLEKGFPPFLFKSSIIVLRCLNNLLGGMSFVILARMTGSQSVGENKSSSIKEGLSEEKQKLVNEFENFQASESTSK